MLTQEQAERAGGAFGRLCLKVHLLYQEGRMHKSGKWSLGTRKPMHALIHLIGEATEVMWEEEAYSTRPNPYVHDRVIMELGDMMGCFVHYLILKKIPPSAVFESAFGKLDSDFPSTGSEKRVDGGPES